MAVYCPGKDGPALYPECLECGLKHPACADRFFCLVVGTRMFADYERLEKAFDRLLSGHAPPGIVIVHSSTAGADMLAERYVKERGVETKVFQANWKLI